MVNLIENDRYQRVCFDPVESDSGDALVYFYHHTHHETETNAHTGAVDTECN
jgi:hypothetical protein